MGWNPSAYVIFGFKTTLADLQTVVPVRGCRHPEQTSKFCPECGKPMFENRTCTVEFDSGSDVQLHYADADHHVRLVGVELAATQGIAEVPAFDPSMLAPRIVQACAEQGITAPTGTMRLFVLRS